MLFRKAEKKIREILNGFLSLSTFFCCSQNPTLLSLIRQSSTSFLNFQCIMNKIIQLDLYTIRITFIHNMLYNITRSVTTYDVSTEIAPCIALRTQADLCVGKRNQRT